MSPTPEDPKVITYRIPRIEVYQVSDDELRRIEDGFGQVGQDLTFAVASLSVCISFVITILSADLSERLFNIFLSLIIISVLVTLYLGNRWLRVKNVAPSVIATIRSRKVDPQSTQENTSDDRHGA